MKVIKRNIIKLFDFISFISFKYWVNIKSKNKTLYIFDLDNTLINTYPLLNKMSLSKVFNNAELHTGMVNLFLNLKSNNNDLIILTSRNYKYYFNTSKFIKKKFSNSSPFYLVSHPVKKIIFIKYAVSKFVNVNYYDDLSYNHEYGEIKFYSDVIEELKHLPVNYFGYHEILKINDV